jgi:ABC-type multidrug transport system fused ATPase/permease subunit
MISVFDFEVSVLERKTQHPRLQVLRRFLKGSWTYFIVCILSGALLTGCEMLIPQIIRITVDSVIGPSPPALPAFLAGRLESIGGMDYFRSHMWLVAGLIGECGADGNQATQDGGKRGADESAHGGNLHRCPSIERRGPPE